MKNTMLSKVMNIIKKEGNTIEAGSTSNCQERYNVIGLGVTADMDLVAIIDDTRPCSAEINIHFSEERIIATGNYDYVFAVATESDPHNKCIEWAHNVNQKTKFGPYVHCQPIIAVISVNDTELHIMMDGIEKAAQLQEENMAKVVEEC